MLEHVPCVISLVYLCEPCGGGSGGRSRPPEAKGSTCSEVHSKGYPASKIGSVGRSFDVFHSTSNDKTFEFFYLSNRSLKETTEDQYRQPILCINSVQRV